MMYIQIRTFGKLQIHNSESKTIVSDFPTRFVGELLVFLLLHPNVKHDRLKLIALFWPDCSENLGRGRLNTTLWRLRNIFEFLGFPAKDLFISSNNYVFFKPHVSIRSDFIEFQELLDEITGDIKSDKKEFFLKASVNIYKGDFCEGIYTDWCLVERERLNRLYLRSLSHLMRLYIEKEDYECAIDVGQRILQNDPLREEVHRALMMCYFSIGMYIEGARQFQRCQQLLLDEMGIAPMLETVQFYEKLVSAQHSLLSQQEDQIIPNFELQEAVGQLILANKNLRNVLEKYEF